MIKYESAVTISRAPAEVFPYLTDPVKQALWSDVPMRQVTPGELKTGSRIEVTFGKGPLKATLGLELTIEEDTRMAFSTYSGPIRWRGQYLLKPAAGGTSLSQEGTLEFTGLWRLLEPFVGGEIKTGEIKELDKLKAAAERA
jgi:hypothetical protein